jgi:hypothetical protein
LKVKKNHSPVKIRNAMFFSILCKPIPDKLGYLTIWCYDESKVNLWIKSMANEPLEEHLVIVKWLVKIESCTSLLNLLFKSMNK